MSTQIEMSALPDEIWRVILKIGIENSKLSYKDLCCISMSCSCLHRLSEEDVLWSVLLSQDFPQIDPSPSSSSSLNFTADSTKMRYKIKFEKDRARKLLAHKRAVLRMESQISEHSRKLHELKMQSEEEIGKLKVAVGELSNLSKARQASVALNVWQPEVIRGRQKQVVEQCVVPIESRIKSLEMEVRLCRQQISGFDKAYKNEKRKLEAADEQLSSMKYHPLREFTLTSSKVDDCNIKRKKLKRCIKL